MTHGVLHVQSRAYPIHYSGSTSAPTTLAVPGRGELEPTAGTLGSLAYNTEPTIDVDLTGLVRPVVGLRGIEVVGCRARVLAAGAILVSYALRHDVDLRTLDTRGIVDLDATVNRQLRELDRPVLEEVLVAAVRSGVLGEITPRPEVSSGTGRQPVDPRAVRYNCHLIARRPGWEPDARVPPVVTGGRCVILLPYTYAWDGDPAMSLADALTMLEPTDVAVAQSALLVGATAGGRRILADLARADREHVDVSAFRRYLDGVWADYHQIDTYRLESAQDDRATFLAVHQVLGLDRARARAEELLRYVGTSLLAESTSRSGQLDRRLNRVAAAFTVVAAAAFLLDIADFMLASAPGAVKGAVVLVVVGLAGVVLGVTFLPGRR